MDSRDIGIIGLGVMGRNIALNFSRHGFSVAVFNPGAPGEGDLLADFLKSHGCDAIAGERHLDDFIAQLRKPRVMLLMVKAGAPVDDVILSLAQRLDPGDIIIDGGNSHYRDTERRMANLEKAGILYVGCGVSGGGEGALRGPSLMPGGSPEAWKTIGPLLQSVAAKLEDGTPCCEWTGRGGAGHFVKMVHNGIEYAMMQAIAEAYDMMRRMAAMGADEMAVAFGNWNAGCLGGYLMGIVPRILKQRDKGALLLDAILDRASQKGTGKESSMAALDMGVPAQAMDEAVAARLISSLLEERRRAAELYLDNAEFSGDREALIHDIEDALYCAIAVSHCQGFALLDRASEDFKWDLDRSAIARLWRGGCIIQSALMNEIGKIISNRSWTGNLLLEEQFGVLIREKTAGWRRSVSTAALHGIPVPVLSSTLAYFDSYRSARLPANLVQAMRDFFGAHGYERIDAQEGRIFRTDWGK
ncbi:MAG: NADP-dependent phosphogluconate dehydrogenase [Spirochaetes bacterium]|nr:NADP-dependent phosphogluconate dehydrogenase [Spirochaetota bacterium]